MTYIRKKQNTFQIETVLVKEQDTVLYNWGKRQEPLLRPQVHEQTALLALGSFLFQQ